MRIGDFDLSDAGSKFPKKKKAEGLKGVSPDKQKEPLRPYFPISIICKSGILILPINLLSLLSANCLESQEENENFYNYFITIL